MLVVTVVEAEVRYLLRHRQVAQHPPLVKVTLEEQVILMLQVPTLVVAEAVQEQLVVLAMQLELLVLAVLALLFQSLVHQ